MPITREIGFGAVARTGRQELHDYGIVRVSDRLRSALLDDSPVIKHRDSSGNQKGAVKVVGDHKDRGARLSVKINNQLADLKGCDRATAIRFFIPPLSWEGIKSLAFSRPTKCSFSSTIVAISRSVFFVNSLRGNARFSETHIELTSADD